MLIILEGCCYAGKTTLAPLLSKYLNLKDMDFKDLFHAKYGMTENEYLVQKEIVEFKYAEKQILEDIINKKYDNMVISLSGSSVYNSDEMRKLKEICLIVFLNVPFEVIDMRRQSDPHRHTRPILFPRGINSFEELYNQRHELYKKYSHLTINITKDETPEETKKKIIYFISYHNI